MAKSINDNMLHQILQVFPKVKLPYEKFIYNKISTAELFIAIPKGTKCYIWITKFNGRDVSFVLYLKGNKIIRHNYYYFKRNKHCKSFSIHNTLIYGTLCNKNKTKFFTLENILLHNNALLERTQWNIKMNLIHNLFQNNIQDLISPTIIISMPFFSNNIEEFKKYCLKPFYDIQKIEYRKFNDYNKCVFTPLKVLYQDDKQMTPSTFHNTQYPKLRNNNFDQEQTFIVKPTSLDDIYELFVENIKGKNNFIDIACVPDYNTSILLNSLFRNIKENKNLDALEESDDEDEFQQDDNQYVFYDREIKMICAFNKKFQKWTPLRVS